jgi:uroporphyrin-III C-methyltransferase
VSGRVTLVGAGPGDPDLLTVRAVKALGLADVVLYDALCDARVFELCPNAKRLYVGKRNRRHALPQETISALLVRFAKRGLQVVRLKAGDPFVFGRGREEVDHVQAFGIPVDVVPGITSAFAAPLAAGIPVTHRGVSRGVLVVSAVPEEPWKALSARNVGEPFTWVFLMGVERRETIARTFLANGYSEDLGVALLLAATTKDERVYRLSLKELPDLVLPPHERDLPGVLVMGDVTRMGDVRASLDWQKGGAA